MTPAKEVGGDFYDFFLIDDDHLALVMADVSGKGVPAALFMVIAKTLIKNHAQMGEYSPAKILAQANEALCEGNEAELFVTVWLAILEISTGRGLAANAGHEHPILRRTGGSYELIEYRHSPAVATMEGIRFREHAFELHPHDTLFVYTDGVAEATNAENKLYGTERLNCPPKAQMQLEVALEEMFVNIAHYAYENTDVPEAERLAEISVCVRKTRGICYVRICLMGKGIPYNPLAKADPDTSLSAEEREIGGLGIYMVKKNMDRVDYAYRDGKNIFTME